MTTPAPLTACRRAYPSAAWASRPGGAVAARVFGASIVVAEHERGASRLLVVVNGVGRTCESDELRAAVAECMGGGGGIEADSP